MKEGFYSVQYAGVADRGFAVIVLDSGMIYGVDVGGVLYDGDYKYNEDTKMLDCSIILKVPAGVGLVQGTPPSPTPYSIPIVASIDRELGSERTIRIETPLGPVNAVFKKLRDFPA